jgi:hypothetical protein
MKTLTALSILTCLMTQTKPAQAAPELATPAAAAKNFYTELQGRRVRGLSQNADWDFIIGLMTRELATAFRGAQVEQADFIKKNPGDKPPWVDGDLFSSLFEGPQTFVIGEAKVTGDTAEVPVTCTHTEGGDTAKWTDTLMLRKTAKGWQLDDVRYGGTWDFANKGTLKQSLAPGGD